MNYNKERYTEPVINLLFGKHEYSEEYLQRMIRNKLAKQVNMPNKLTTVDWHKQVFGQQSYCYFNGEFRYWVWDFGDWRIWINNTKGVSIEVDPSFTDQQAMDVLRSYWDRMGL